MFNFKYVKTGFLLGAFITSGTKLADDLRKYVSKR